jgi:hypothetical protein
VVSGQWTQRNGVKLPARVEKPLMLLVQLINGRVKPLLLRDAKEVLLAVVGQNTHYWRKDVRQAEFEKLIIASGMKLLGSMQYGPVFLVSLHVEREFGVRVQCDHLTYTPGEFAMLTPERAKQQIEACRARLERAAHTQQGVVCYPTTERKVAPKKTSVAPVLSTIQYPAH